MDEELRLVSVEFLPRKMPRFSWQFPTLEFEGTQRGVSQSAYRIRIAQSAEALSGGGELLWDSGKVESDACLHIPYEGEPLSAGQRVFYDVRVWDEHDESFLAQEPRECVVGELGPEDWQGHWIGPEPSLYPLESAALLRREFRLRAEPVSATLFVTGLGNYEVFLNGARVGERQLDPVFSDYRDRVYYSAYDVTNLLQSGANAAGMHLGNGRYRQHVDASLGDDKAPWRGPLKALFQLQVEYADGSREVVATDEEWKTAQSPVIYCSLFAGETLDVRLNQPGWAAPGFDESDWTPAVVLDPPGGRLEFQTCLPTGRFPDMEPVSVQEIGDGERLYDFGLNLCGGVAVLATGKPGQEIQIHKSEFKDRKGQTLRQPGPDMIKGGRIQEDRLIVGEDGKAEFETTFSISGFRHVLARGLSEGEDALKIRAFETRAAVPLTGHFECSNSKVNLLHQMFLRTYLSNMQCGIPTDNCTRERRGYGMDGQQWAEAMLYNGDSAAFYRKWAIDYADAQQESGFIPYYAPIGGHNIQSQDGSLPGWSDPWWSFAVIHVPLMVHRFSNDPELLAQLWPNMRRFLLFLDEQYAGDRWQGWGLGDWLEVGGQTRAKRTPKGLTTLVAGIKAATDGTTVSRILEREEEVAFCQELREKWRRQFNENYRRPDGSLDVEDAQTAWVFDILLELGDDLEPSKRALLQNIQQREGRHSTGILGTNYLFKVLTDMGQSNLAWSILTAEGDWGWMDWVKAGRSTVPEMWGGQRAQNQPALGSIDDWFYRDVAGIAPDLDQPAFKQVRLRPQFIKELEWAKAHVGTPYGQISSSWKRGEGGSMEWQVSIPPNTTALAELPAGARQGTESRKPLAEASGVRVDRTESATTRLLLQSGAYRFQFHI